MRNALVFICLLGVSTLIGLCRACGSTPVYASDASDYVPADFVSIDSSASGMREQLLPVRGSDLPLPTSSFNGMSAAGPQEPIVEAIPTPTAFQTGGFLLGAIWLARLVRKVRLA